MGGRVDDGFFGYNPDAARVLEQDLARLVPFAAGAEVTNSWGGPIDRTVDGVPMFGRLPGRVPIVYGVGYSGNGVAPCLTGGKILASSALGRDDEWSSCGLNLGPQGRFPPEPIRYVGGFVVRSAVRRKERREDEGRSVDVLTRKVAGLAPPSFFRVDQ
jgi:glycine/D-amino acid oxidase-like deaminating enzyme